MYIAFRKLITVQIWYELETRRRGSWTVSVIARPVKHAGALRGKSIWTYKTDKICPGATSTGTYFQNVTLSIVLCLVIKLDAHLTSLFLGPCLATPSLTRVNIQRQYPNDVALTSEQESWIFGTLRWTVQFVLSLKDIDTITFECQTFYSRQFRKIAETRKRALKMVAIECCMNMNRLYFDDMRQTFWKPTLK